MIENTCGWRQVAAMVGALIVLLVGLGTAGQAVAAGENRTASASKTSGLNPDGETVTVTGSGFDSTKGVYVALCVDNGPGELATPCLGGVDMEGAGGASAWISSNPPDYGEGLAEPYGPDGSFQVSLQIAAADQNVDCRTASNGCVIFVRADHTRSSDRSQDYRIPVTFGDDAADGGDSGAADSDPAGALPTTGVTIVGIAGAALLLLGLGAALMLAAKYRRIRRGVAALAALPLAAGILIGAPAPSAQAAEQDVIDGTLSWGVRTSFQNYVTGPIADGEISTDDGASVADGRFHFPDGAGTIDPDSGTTQLAFVGSVHFSGHDYGNGPLLDITLSNLRIVADGADGTVVADIDSRPFQGTDPTLPPPPVEHHADVELVTVDLSGQELTPADDGTVAVTDAPTTLTEAGSEAFAGFYPAGDPFDPVSFTATVDTGPEVIAPVVTVHPDDVTVEVDEDATFTAEASGDPVPTISWESSPDGTAWTVIDNAPSAELTVAEVTPDQDGTQYRAVFSNDAGAATSEPATLTVTEEPEPEPVAVTVEPSTDLPVTDAEVTVTGSDFASTGSQANGVYVGVAPADVTDQADWFSNASYYAGVQWVQVGPDGIDEDGSFTTMLTFDATFTSGGEDVDCADVECGVYTFAAHGSTDRSQDTYTPLTFADEEPVAEPELTVEPSEDLRTGDDIEITGSGYAPGRWLYVAVTPQEASGEGNPSPFSNSKRIRTTDDGTFETTIEDLEAQFTNEGVDVDCLEVDCYVASFSSPLDEDNEDADYHDDRSQDVFVPMTFAADDPGPDPDPNPDPDPDPGPDPDDETDEPLEITDGTMDWGVKESFRTYITGPIADGSWDVSDGATENGTSFRFVDAAGTYIPDNVSADAALQGMVRFTGHDSGDGPLLDFTISNPSVEIDGSSGTLLLDVRSKGLDDPDEWFNESQVPFATLDLSGQDLSPADGIVTLTDIPATLTEDGAEGFAGFYEAGAELDPVSLTLALDDTDLPDNRTPDDDDDAAADNGPNDPSLATGSTTGPTTGGGLPKTGRDWALAALVGLGLIGAGAGITLGVRRRTAS